MRCEIAASLLHSPKILFLDEPTIGLDANSKIVVRNFIKEINKTNKITVILTTHDMSDIEYLASRIILIGKGKVLYDGSLDKIKNLFDKKKIVRIKTNDNLDDINIKGIIDINKEDNTYVYRIDTSILSLSSFIKKLSTYNIDDIDVENQNIDDIILNLYEEYL